MKVNRASIFWTNGLSKQFCSCFSGQDKSDTQFEFVNLKCFVCVYLGMSWGVLCSCNSSGFAFDLPVKIHNHDRLCCCVPRHSTCTPYFALNSNWVIIKGLQTTKNEVKTSNGHANLSSVNLCRVFKIRY